jgi:hypothetical protein
MTCAAFSFAISGFRASSSFKNLSLIHDCHPCMLNKCCQKGLYQHDFCKLAAPDEGCLKYHQPFSQVLVHCLLASSRSSRGFVDSVWTDVGARLQVFDVSPLRDGALYCDLIFLKCQRTLLESFLSHRISITAFGFRC